MSGTIPPRWYCVAADGVACVCVDQEDAEQSAKMADMDWPRNGPHRAVLLVDAESLSMVWGALGACRDAMPDTAAVRVNDAIADPKAVPDYVRASVAQLVAQRDALVAALQQIADKDRFDVHKLDSANPEFIWGPLGGIANEAIAKVKGGAA